MTSTAELKTAHDITDVPSIVTGSVKLGLLETVLVLLFAVASRFLEGVLEAIVCGLILIVGLAAVTVLPGLWTRSRTIEGIAGAAGIGLGAAGVFLLLDVILLQNIGTYSHRWHAVGGGSNWWYHPVWWMVGSYLPWMGAWILANQSAKADRPDVPATLLAAFAFSILLAVLAILLGFPGAGWNLATFAVGFLPGLTLATLFFGLRSRRA
jgi:hypothetical protein